jgi:acetyl esterase/lipase
MMRLVTGITIGGLLLAGAAIAQERQRLPRECRQDIMKLCRGAVGGFSQCLRSVLPRMSDECRKAASDRAMAREERPDGMIEVAYGADARQRMDLLVPQDSGSAPVLFFVHGGGWSIGDKVAGGATKGPWASRQGWAYASANYRLVPQVTVEQQAADLANAIAWLRANAASHHLDPDRVVLMGHGAGAHLVALLGTDTRYLKAAGVPLGAVKGVVLLDGAGYDVPTQASAERNIVQPMYETAFSTNPERQAALSPTRHAAAPNAANWLILPVKLRADSQAQSKALAGALVKAGSSAAVAVVPGESHRSLNTGLGEQGDYATKEVERFLASVR